jgi:hypothetical protein
VDGITDNVIFFPYQHPTHPQQQERGGFGQRIRKKKMDPIMAVPENGMLPKNCTT